MKKNIIFIIGFLVFNVYAEVNIFSDISNGNVMNVKLEIERGYDINSTDKHGRSLLMVAARNQEKELVIYLLEKGADKNIKDKNGFTVINILESYINRSGINREKTRKNLEGMGFSSEFINNQVDSPINDNFFGTEEERKNWEEILILVKNNIDENKRNNNDNEMNYLLVVIAFVFVIFLIFLLIRIKKSD